jgi:two-component system chemotaxis response regulator CheB
VRKIVPIRVLVIDDSAFSRQTITRMLDSSPLVDVVGSARDGEEALRKTIELEPDLVTLDLEMPRMDGFTFLRLLMSRRPTPVLVISGRSGAKDVFQALELGAADFIAKPTRRATPELHTIEGELLRKVHAIRELRVDKLSARLERSPSRLGASAWVGTADRVVVVGASTGGPASLLQVLRAFDEVPPWAWFVSQHMPAGFTRSFAERVDRLTVFEAREAQGGDPVQPGLVLVAPGGRHLEFEDRHGETRSRLVEGASSDRYAPSVDRMFASAAKHFGARLTALVLTGMGDDGARGVRAVHEAGGIVVAESEATAVVFGMPQQAIRTGAVDVVAPLEEVAAAVAGLPGVRTVEGSETAGSSDEERDARGFGEPVRGEGGS